METLIAAALIVVLLLQFWLIFKAGRQQAVLLRQDARMDEQGRRAEAVNAQVEARTRQVEEVIRQLDQHMRDSHALGQQQQQDAIHQLQQTLLARFGELQHGLERRLGEALTSQTALMGQLREQLQGALAANQNHFEVRQNDALKNLLEGLQAGMERVQRQVSEALTRNAEEMGKRVDALTQSTDNRLQEISGQVEKRLSEGFEKTTATFADVVKRLALIDEAQKKITELSGNVVSLQEVLSDKRSRGAFGEVQLSALVRNVLPESSFANQYTLKNGTRVDCILFLPEPTGNVAIDAKFPLENFRRLTDLHLPESERKNAERLFKQDIRKHIQDISSKYIVPGQTADGAVMFIPAEAVFAEIHAHHPDVVEEAQKARVWMCSPTTLMAILTTARAVLKDAATRQQVHIIQDHLAGLSKDFNLFQKRMEALASHIRLANKDVDEISTSASKITKHFHKIERVELEDLPAAQLRVVDGVGEE